MMGGMKRAAVLLASIAVLSGACADRPSTPEPAIDARAAVLDAMRASYEASTMHQEFEMSMSAGGQSFAFSGRGDVDNDHQLAAMSMDLGMLGGTMEMIVDGPVLYLRSELFQQQGVHTEWVKMDASKMDPAVAAQFGGGAGMTDPSAYTGLFAGIVDVELVGEETIDGVETTRFRGTIDLGRVLDEFPSVLGEDVNPARTKALREALQQFEAMGIEGRIPFGIWLDADGLPRRQVITMDLGDMLGTGSGASMEITVDYSAYGEPIHVEIPDPSEVTDLTEELSASGSLQG
jgi:hypothetical protein